MLLGIDAPLSLRRYFAGHETWPGLDTNVQECDANEA